MHDDQPAAGAAASPRSPAAKITERSSRFAYTSTTRPRPARSTDLRMDITGVIPLPAANSRKSPSSERGLNVPAGGSRSSTVPAVTLSAIQFDAYPPAGSLDRDRRPLPGQRRTRQRVAPGHRPGPVGRHAHGDELARPVGERAASDGGTSSTSEDASSGLADHLRHRHLEVLAGSRRCYSEGGDTSSRPDATAASMLSRRVAHPSTSALGWPSGAAARNSAQARTAAAVHCTDVCCGLNFATSTAAPHRAHSTGAGPPRRPGWAGAFSRHQRVGPVGRRPDLLAGPARGSPPTSASQPATARVVSISNSNRATMSGSMSATSL